ncbi:MAG: hypothetical protein RL094_656 [Candidatus Parcubacteria bacterium]|jgi:glycosyltransferase involved in cell wall biosynthesis
MFLSIIIPCYNEEQRIKKTLTRINEYLSHQQYESEVIVVDNGSTDTTKAIVEAYISDMKNLRIISKKSYGKGWAVKQGMIEATGEYRLFTDADNSTDIAHLDTFLPVAQHEGYDVVISSRRVAGATIAHPQPWHRRILSNMFAFIVRSTMPLGIKDTQNGFKLFSKKAAKKIFSMQTIYYWAFDVEILALAKKFDFRIKEVPIKWMNDEDSKMNFKGMARMLLEVITIRFRMMTNSYTNR